MKHRITATSILVALLAPAPAVHANTYQTETREGERHIIPKDESKITAEVAIMQRRAIDMGLFHWPVPKAKVEIDQTSRPQQVSDCTGHDPAYVPPHQIGVGGDWIEREIAVARGLIYEWMAYRNAIITADCSCGSLTADWDEAVSAFENMRDGVDNFKIYSHSPISMRTTIKRDFDGMCDVQMDLELN